MKEVLYSTNYNDALCSYLVEKETDKTNISIIIYDISTGSYSEIERIRYKNIGEEYFSPFLSWYNLFFCSNFYGPPPDYEYMHYSVQNGKKTAATVYLEPNSEEEKRLVENLPEDCDSLPYSSKIIYVFHKGRLADFFDFDEIRALYEKHEVSFVNWNVVKEYFEKDLSFFADEQACGFSLQSGGNDEQIIIKGLILGYPVESTIALFLEKKTD